ncbi:Transcriptional regulatory protein YpdB [Pseudoalteromonas sp. P1-9]|uniref:LytR/AlgR family response regulator transcription factor n=1 Tax=Pseudoalteromonas sp. P1-9 TaxID=1710354 RepID=UPI0006D5F9DE|nr:LytTR family DNA-binding domain-containing protein [Pseudoalteromonas sp. P1-9]KPV93780.1 Transcriptional regulatory protein YpdB [Pseudoalteromonas sp. P1-9]
MAVQTQKNGYRCIIVDDEALGRELIEMHLAQFAEFELVASCSSAIEAHQLLQNQSVDLLFLDIEMPVLKGTDFYQNLAHKPYVIFTTAYRDYAIEGFELDAVDYLLKPIVFSRFFKAIEKFKQRIAKTPHAEPSVATQQTPNAIFVRENRKQVRIVFDNVLYVEGLKDYIKIFLHDGSHIIKSSMSAFESQLPSNFARVHRSFIVNLDYISAYAHQYLELGEIEIPIGDQFREKLQEKLC